MLTKDTPKLLFSETTKGLIWKVVLDDQHHIMVWEARNSNKEVCFYAYDFVEKAFLMKEKTFEEEWQIGVINVYDGVLYLHSFENEHAPTHKGIIAYDLFHQKIIWENYNSTAENIFIEGIVSYNSRLFPKKLELLNLKTGELIQQLKHKDLATLSPILNNIKLPINNAKLTGWKTEQELRLNDLHFKAYYTKHDDIINNMIVVYRDDELILEDFLNENIRKLIEDTFFVWLGKLVYIKNKSEIVTYLV